MLQDRLIVKFQDVKYPKFKHEIFARIDMKQSYFSNVLLFAINFFVEIIIELFVVSQNI